MHSLREGCPLFACSFLLIKSGFFFQNNCRLIINKNLHAFVLTRALSLKFSLTTHNYKNSLPRSLPHNSKKSPENNVT